MSQLAVPSSLPSAVRKKPRWSVASSAPTLSTQSPPPSIAGLPGSGACVWVRPPLFWSGPSWGAPSLTKPVVVQAATVCIKLLPSGLIVPTQSSGTLGLTALNTRLEFPARIVFWKLKALPADTNTPPPAPFKSRSASAKLSVIVTLNKFTVPLIHMPPPEPEVLLPLTVLLVSVTVPALLEMPM